MTRPQHACGRAPQERAPPRRCPTPSNEFHACNSGARDWLATPDCDGGGLPQCSFCSSSNATAYLRWITDVLAQKYAQRCHSFVGYSASLSTGWCVRARYLLPVNIPEGCTLSSLPTAFASSGFRQIVPPSLRPAAFFVSCSRRRRRLPPLCSPKTRRKCRLRSMQRSFPLLARPCVAM